MVAAGCECRPPGPSMIVVEPIRAPAEVTFPSAYVGFFSEQHLVLTNPARTQRTLSLEITAPFAGPSEVTIEGGEERAIALRFSPAIAGAVTGSITLTELGQSPIEVSLRGEGLEVPDCPAPEPCRTFEFDPSSGECVARLAEDGVTCSGLACFVGARCLAGECLGSAVTCDDQNPCTLDICSEVGCGQVDRTPYCPRSDNPCLVPTCEGDAGCGFVEALDGTACGERTCTTARVCISGTCVTRVPPRNQSCAELIVGVPAGTGSHDGLGSEARFYGLRSIALQGADALIIDEARLRRVSRDGRVTSIAGQFGSPGSRDGFGTAARVGGPVILGLAPSTSPGTFFLGQSNTVKFASIAGLVTTLAGKPDAGGVVDGVGSAARLTVSSQLVLSNRGRARFLQIEQAQPPQIALREVSLVGEVRTLGRFSAAALPGFDSSDTWRAFGHVIDTADDATEANIGLSSLTVGRVEYWNVRLSPDGGMSTTGATALQQTWRRDAGVVGLEACAALFLTDLGSVRTALDCVASGARDVDGGLWVVGSARLQLASANGRQTLAGPDPDRSIVDGTSDGGRLVWPRGLTHTDAGVFFVDGPEQNLVRVRRLDPSGRLQTVDAGFIDLSGVVNLGPLVAAITPLGRTTLIDPATLAIVETRQLPAPVQAGVASNGVELRDPSLGVSVLSFDGGSTPTTNAFVHIRALAAAPGNTWVVLGETDRAAISRPRLFLLDSTGTVTLLAGAFNADAEVDGPALQAQLGGGTEHLAVASDGTIYFSSFRSNRIRQLRAGQVTTLIELADRVTGLTAMPDGSLIVGVDAALLRVVP